MFTVIHISFRFDEEWLIENIKLFLKAFLEHFSAQEERIYYKSIDFIFLRLTMDIKQEKAIIFNVMV